MNTISFYDTEEENNVWASTCLIKALEMYFKTYHSDVMYNPKS